MEASPIRVGRMRHGVEPVGSNGPVAKGLGLKVGQELSPVPSGRFTHPESPLPLPPTPDSPDSRRYQSAASSQAKQRLLYKLEP
jgi:hypothetical protein